MSYETQLGTTYHKLTKPKETMKTTHTMVLDFEKAFDKVSHSLLMQ